MYHVPEYTPNPDSSITTGDPLPRHWMDNLRPSTSINCGAGVGSIVDVSSIVGVKTIVGVAGALDTGDGRTGWAGLQEELIRQSRTIRQKIFRFMDHHSLSSVVPYVHDNLFYAGQKSNADLKHPRAILNLATQHRCISPCCGEPAFETITVFCDQVKLTFDRLFRLYTLEVDSAAQFLRHAAGGE